MNGRVSVFTAANHHYSRVLSLWIQQVKRFDLEYTIYDLGDLGMGVPWRIDDDHFQVGGFYRTPHPRYRARALHKPAVVLDHLGRIGDGCYLDADALPLQSIDYPDGDWDLAVTVRRKDESYGLDVEAFTGEINAGVMFFRPTARTVRFVQMWEEETKRRVSDQGALNGLIGADLPRDGSIVERLETRIKCLSTDVYNFYYRPEPVPPSAKVIHLKNMTWDDPRTKGWMAAALGKP